MQRFGRASFTALLLTFYTVGAAAQSDSDRAKILPHITVLYEHVVQEQWPALGNFIHMPVDAKLVEPGQCVRFAVGTTGISGDQVLQQATQMLQQTSFSFEVRYAGQSQGFAAAPSQRTKEVTAFNPETLLKGFRSVQAMKDLVQSHVLAASTASWCVPAEATDGTATITGSAMTTDGKTIKLERRTIEVKTFETARKRALFKDLETVSDWPQHYHLAPDPALLLAAMRIFAANDQARNLRNILMFFATALQANKIAAEELLRKLPEENAATRLYCAAALAWAGYPIESLTTRFDDTQKIVLASLRKPDPFDQTPSSDVGARQDMLWGIFFATGRLEPVRAIAGELAWGDDYDRFQGGQAGEMNDTVFRAVGYGAAGWSIGALAFHDSLLQDYIEVLQCSADISPAIKRELANLHQNPAFEYEHRDGLKKRSLPNPPRQCGDAAK